MPPPLISQYKKWFAVKRLLQTFLGGFKLVSSPSILLFQILIYIIPGVIVCVGNVADSSTLRWEGKALLTGLGVLLTDVTLTFLIWILKQRRDANITPEFDRSTDSPVNSATSATLFDEEEAVPDDGWFKSSTWRFIASNVNMSMCHFCAVLAAAISTFFSMSVIADESVHPVLKCLVVFTVCNARFSSVISAAPEVATFDPVNRRHLFYRPFYTAFCASINFAILIIPAASYSRKEGFIEYNGRTGDVDGEDGGGSGLPDVSKDPSSSSTPFAILLSALPLIWLSGILPPLDALFPWLFETILSQFGGKSVGHTYFGTTVSLSFAIAGSLATFTLSHQPKVTLLLECLCGYLISCDTGVMPKLKPSLCEDIPAKYFLRQLIKPAVTIACSLLSILVAETVLSETATTSEVAHRDLYHPIFASISIFILLTTKLLQVFDIVHRKWAHSRLVFSIFAMWHGLLTVILHVWLSVELLTEHLEEKQRTKNLEQVVQSLQQLLPCVLAIRFFALSITEPHTSTINIFIAFLYQSLGEGGGSASQTQFVSLLFYISLLHEILKRFIQYTRMMVIFTHSTLSSPLIERKYAAGAALLSVPLSLFSVLMTSVVRGMSLVPIFTLPIFTVGFPRPQSFWKGMWFLRSCARNETQRIMPIANSVDATIYSDVAPFLVHAFAKRSEEAKTNLESGSCYIARYDDRLLFIRILSSGWKFLYAQVKGLEIQEQTSCHHQEAAWMDELFEKYLQSGRSCMRALYTWPTYIVNSLVPKFCVSVPSYSESKSQLPTFLNDAGKQIFRDMFFRAFSFLWIKSNPAFQGESYRRPIASGVPLAKGHLGRIHPQGMLFQRSSRLRNGHLLSNGTGGDYRTQQLNSVGGSDLNGNRAHTFLKDVQPLEGSSSLGGARGASAPMILPPRQHPPLKSVSASVWNGSVSYPLIPGLPNLAIEDTELESLAFSLNPSTNERNVTDPKEIQSGTSSPPSVLMQKNASKGVWDGLPQFWMKQCVGDAIPHNAVKARVEKLCWKAWEVAFGTHDDLYEVDMARFYRREFAKNIRTGMVPEKPDFEDIAVRAFRYATKLTLDEVYASGMDIDDSIKAPLSASRRHNEIPEDAIDPVLRSEEDEQGIFHQLSTFEKAHCFCPFDEVPYWMNEKAKHIVSICADGDKNILRMFNYQSEGVEFAIGELSKYCVEGIWSSLNTELLYLTSDDDERFSIQHDKYLVRNICAQSAQTLGYPVYEATFRVNLFDFSLEQVSI